PWHRGHPPPRPHYRLLRARVTDDRFPGLLEHELLLPVAPRGGAPRFARCNEAICESPVADRSFERSGASAAEPRTRPLASLLRSPRRQSPLRTISRHLTSRR